MKYKTYQRDDVRERKHFQICHIFVARRAGRRTGFRASYVALVVVLVVALVCGQSRDFRVCRRVPNRARRRVPNRARVGVFCSYACIPLAILAKCWRCRVLP